MRRIIWLSVALLALATPASAQDITTQDLPTVGPLSNGDLIVITRTGTTFNASWPASLYPLASVTTAGAIYALNSTTTSNWVSYIDGAGIQHLSQPSFGDISGIASASQIPLPTISTVGGVQSSATVTNNFVTGLNTSGALTKAQPDFSNLSGNISISQMNSGIGATTTTYFDGSGHWSSPASSGGGSPGGTTNAIQSNGGGSTFSGSSSGTGLYVSTTNHSEIDFLNNTTTANLISIPKNGADYTGVGVGGGALASQTVTGIGNTMIGYQAGHNMTTASYNVGVGYQTLFNETTTGTGGLPGFGDVAIGYQAGKNLSTGSFSGGNVYIGYQSGFLNSAMNLNVCIGVNTCSNTTFGGTITAIGAYANAFAGNGGEEGGATVYVGTNAGIYNTGSWTTVLGAFSMNHSGTSVFNAWDTIVGANVGNKLLSAQGLILIGTGNGSNSQGVGGEDTALSNTSTAVCIGAGVSCGSNDVGVGAQALHSTTTNFNDNTAIGYRSLGSVTTGKSDVAIGYTSGQVVTTGSGNLILGAGVGSTTLTTGSNNILIGTSSAIDVTASGDSSKLNIGNMLFQNLAGTGAPTFSGCGASPSADAHANNYSGKITVGTGSVTSCSVIFSSAYTSWSHCRVTPETASIAAFGYTYSTTSIVVTATSLTSDVFDYQCDGY